MKTGPLTLGGNQIWLDEFSVARWTKSAPWAVAYVDDISTLMRTPVVAGTARPATVLPAGRRVQFQRRTATDRTGLGTTRAERAVVRWPVWAGLVVRRHQDLVAIADANDSTFTTGMTLEAWVRPNNTERRRLAALLLKEGPQGLVYGRYASDQVAARGGAGENRQQ